MDQKNDLPAVERDIAEKIAAAKLRLRFDKVALRLIRKVQDGLAPNMADGEALLFTVTAPIKLPAQTAQALESLARGLPPKQGIGETVLGNDVRLRRIEGVPPGRPRVLGFVHNPESDAVRILDLAAMQLSGA